MQQLILKKKEGKLMANDIIKIERHSDTFRYTDDTKLSKELEGTILEFEFHLDEPKMKLTCNFKKILKNRKEKRIKLQDNSIRDNFFIYLIHHFYKKDIDRVQQQLLEKYATTHNIDLLNSRYKKSYEIKKGDDYYIFSYYFNPISYNAKKGFLQISNLGIIDGHYINTNFYFNLNDIGDVIAWYKWHFDNILQFKIDHEFNIHQKIQLLEDNKKYRDEKYNDYANINQLRKNISNTVQELKAFIVQYYNQLTSIYDKGVQEMKAELSEYKNSVIEKDHKIQLSAKEKVEQDILKQQELFTYIKKEDTNG